jgi:hypothetical protein
MRPTLHDYVIDLYGKGIYHPASRLVDIVNFAKLTNREPRLGDFVPCDDGGNVLQKPEGYDKWLLEDYYTEVETSWIRDCSKYQTAKDKVIFAGDWKVLETGFDTLTHHYLDSEYLGKSYSLTVISNGTHNIEFRDNDCGVWLSNKNHIGELQINRIEDLPREIEFKNGVI